MVCVRFLVSYLTQWGERVFLQTCRPNDATPARHEMSCRWEGKRLLWELTLRQSLTGGLSYNYVVLNDKDAETKNENVVRRIATGVGFGQEAVIHVRDTWQDLSSQYAVLTHTAFRRAIGFIEKLSPSAAPLARRVPEAGTVILRFVVRDWMSKTEGKEFFVTGSLASLGNWQQEKVLSLSPVGDYAWEGEVLVPAAEIEAAAEHALTYKYAQKSEKGLVLESGESRLAPLPRANADMPDMMVLEDGHFRHEKRWKGAGIAVPVFSLRSEKSLGVGDFADLLLLIDLCVELGLEVIQILPINDTRVHRMWWDSYPYSSLSVFALHPIYLRLEALSSDLPSELMERIAEARAALDGPCLQYDETLAKKMELAMAVYVLDNGETLASRAFGEFFAANKEWLAPYAAFLFLQGVFGTSEHWQWGKLANPTDEDIARLVDPEDDRFFHSIGFTYWLQYHLKNQLHNVKLHAEAKRVALKGDLPIGVDKCSVDTWMCPSLFRMDKSTGAPPDGFDPNGQNWGFPTYNWEEMEKDDYAWWRKRLGQMTEYFHAYRIDHVLGFFRIWEIPDVPMGLNVLDTSVTAMLGRFRPSKPLKKSELESHGIWDFDRLCTPHATWEDLEQVFGDLTPEIATTYFREDQHHRFLLKENVRSEIKIQRTLGHLPEEAVEVQFVKESLLRIAQNVVLLRDPHDPDSFYPRFDLMLTRTYQALDPEAQQELRLLHDDYYFARQDALWRAHAMKTLPALMRGSDMLVCGEDLGMIPTCVHPVMEELGLIGMRIQRMPTEGEFGDPMEYPYLTVCCAACHDVTTIRAWWEEDRSRTQRFYNQMLRREGAAPTTCTPEVVQDIIQQHFQSPSVLAIIQIQDLFALSEKYNGRPPREETINNPVNPRHYWRYRMHVSLETLMDDQELKRRMHGLLKRGSRGFDNWIGKRCWVSTNGSRRAPNNENEPL